MKRENVVYEIVLLSEIDSCLSAGIRFVGDNTNKGGTNTGGTIDKILTNPDVDGFYDANVSKVDLNGNIVPKVDGNMLRRNDMFPDNWEDVQRFNEEFAVASTRKTKVPDTWNQWEC
jgi:hypothetical protein